MEKAKENSKSKHSQKDYSLAFKLMIVDEVENVYFTLKYNYSTIILIIESITSFIFRIAGK